MLSHITCSNRFSFSSFKHSLTLFSKFFSSFPHGTCSLSVSRKYLALDEVYHPLCTSSTRSTTLRTHTGCSELHATDGILTLYDAPFQGTYTRVTCWYYVSRPQRAELIRAGAFQSELFPLHSPLLRESLLVSFPPLNYMLKFSGSPYFI